jgi:hypothetical protein
MTMGKGFGAARAVMLAFCAAMFFAAGANAEHLDAKQWRFSLTFPCQSAPGSQMVDTELGKILMTMYSCGGDNDAYMIAINDYPKGTVTPDNIDAVYTGVIDGASSNTNGKIRNIAPFTLGNVTGREALIDVSEQGGAVRTRVFLVGDRLYQVMFIGPNGQENSKGALDFLNSFTLLP